jgi:hypothetical protein
MEKVNFSELYTVYIYIQKKILKNILYSLPKH